MAVTKYSETEKARICAEVALSGDDAAVCDRFGLKPSTLRAWKSQAWWRDMTIALHERASQQLVAKANRAMNTALDELDDRLHRGDLKVAIVRGEPLEYREPVKARDLGAIVNVLATRSEKAAALAKNQETNYQLADLQSSFREFAKSYREKQIKDQHAIPHESASDTQQDNKTANTSTGE